MQTDTAAALRWIEECEGRADACPGPEWRSDAWGIACGEAWWERIRIDHYEENDREYPQQETVKAFVIAARTDVPLLAVAARALVGIATHISANDRCPFCGMALIIEGHSPDCPALALDAALAALASAAGDGDGRGSQQ